MQLLPVSTVPLVEPGVDLGAVLVEAAGEAGLAFESGDVAVVTGKIVSKAEGRLVDLRSIEPSRRAFRLAEICDVRGLDLADDHARATDLVRPADRDMFALPDRDYS